MALLWSEPDDVRSRWIGDAPLSADDATLTVLLEDAEDLVLREFPDLQTRVPDPVPLSRVKRVLARVVIRHLRNPEGYRTMMETGGPFSQNVTFGGEDPGALYLTEADRADLTSLGKAGAFMIDTTPTLPPAYGTGPESWLNLGGTWY